MLKKSRAVVLSVLRYNDENLICRLLTPADGVLTMLVRVSRSRRAAVRYALFRPLAVLELEWEHRASARMVRPKSAAPALPLASLPYEPRKSAVALFLAEFLSHAVRAEPDSAALYHYVERSIEWLDTAQAGFANFHLVFLLRLTHFLGIAPNVEAARPGSYFDLRAAQFVAARPAHPDFLPPRSAAVVPLVMRMRYDTMHRFRFSGAERSELLTCLNTYYRLHLPSFPELKSLDVLRELFAAGGR